jgi:hypothetical protein
VFVDKSNSLRVANGKVLAMLEGGLWSADYSCTQPNETTGEGLSGCPVYYGCSVAGLHVGFGANKNVFLTYPSQTAAVPKDLKN